MTFGTLRSGAVLMGLASLLHLAAAVWTGLPDLVLAGCAIIVALGLTRGWRWFGWLVLVGITIAIGLEAARLTDDPAPVALIWGLIVLDCLTVATLFVALWQPRTAPG